MSLPDRVKRLRKLSLGARPSVSSERAELITEFYEQDHGTLSAPMRRALAFKHI